MTLTLEEVLNKRNFEYFESRDLDLAEAIAAEVKQGKTANQVYNTVYQSSGYSRFATRAASAAKHCEMLRDQKQ